jgi:hypothetical protein
VLSIPVVATVATFGELSVQALLVVSATGLAIVWRGLARRAGAAAAPVGVGGLPWCAWLVVLALWELAMDLDDRVPTLSDLADPVLAHPVLRGLATVGWLAAGFWLVARPAAADPDGATWPVAPERAS